MLLVIFLFLLAISFIEVLGWLNPLFRYLVFGVIFTFLLYQYYKIRQLGKERLLTQEELTRTNEIIQKLLTTTNFNKLLSLIIDNLIREKRFCSVFIYKLEENSTLKCIATNGAVALKGINKFTFVPEQDKMIERTIRLKTPITIQNTGENQLIDKEITENLKLKQFILLPLAVQDKILGLIIIGNDKDKITFTSKDIAISTAISNQAAVALQNAQLYLKIQELSIIDELTQVYNHRFFQQRITEETELAKRYNSILSLAIIDIDHFKNYNDKNGHLAGNDCIKQVAKIISQSLRRTDIVSRYGGDEFALILPATDKYGAIKILEKIKTDVEKYPFEFRHNQPNGKLTISVGASIYPQDAKESMELINIADKSLYRAKKLGRNRVIAH
ncbi:MAG: sensor domain-containing diguanylate cyclase [Elusimicrobia bacterium]|nr:sensor domain-containing diguanylate cyclase [Elusimicrobiota bacterium]